MWLLGYILLSLKSPSRRGSHVIYKGSCGRFESQLVIGSVHPQKLSWNPKITVWKGESSSTTSSSGLIHVSSVLAFGWLTCSQGGNPRMAQNGAQQMDGWLLQPKQCETYDASCLSNWGRNIPTKQTVQDSPFKKLKNVKNKSMLLLNQKLKHMQWWPFDKKTDHWDIFPLTLQFELPHPGCLVGTTTSSVSSVSPLRRGARRRSAPTYPAYPAHDSRK